MLDQNPALHSAQWKHCFLRSPDVVVLAGCVLGGLQQVFVMATAPVAYADFTAYRQIRPLSSAQTVPVHQSVRLPARWHNFSLKNSMNWNQHCLRQRDSLSGRNAATRKLQSCRASATTTSTVIFMTLATCKQHPENSICINTRLVCVDQKCGNE